MTTERGTLAPTVAIIGGGPAGLSAAIELRKLGVEGVVVLERESDAGGIPRVSDHTGYGIRDLHTVMSGPAYAERLVRLARDWRVDLRAATMVTEWVGDRSVLVTGPEGRLRVDAQAIVLATGARERPRTARMIPGDRPSGVMTTGQLQNLVHGAARGSSDAVGTRAVVVGAELVSWSAVLTLREADCGTVMMTTEHDRAESYAAFTVPGRAFLRVPVSRSTRITRIVGRQRVEAVEVTHSETGRRRLVACDTVVLTGDWIPDNELARLRGLGIDGGSRSPLVDAALRTTADGIFAAGNLLHPVDTADVAALDGRHVATSVLDYLAGGRVDAHAVRLLAGPGLAWVAPGLVRADGQAPPRGRVLMWPTEHWRLARVVVEQGGRVVGKRTLPWPASPGRVLRVPWSVFAGLHPDRGDATVSLR
ncbi:MAG: FAD-dependent oxidoreductase [bacterium]|nr:FAD-dependent oxidoreductase [bacterium]